MADVPTLSLTDHLVVVDGMMCYHSYIALVASIRLFASLAQFGLATSNALLPHALNNIPSTRLHAITISLTLLPSSTYQSYFDVLCTTVGAP